MLRGTYDEEKYWQDLLRVTAGRTDEHLALQAGMKVVTLRYLGGGHEGQDGCNDADGGFSQHRRRLHHAMFYGFLACFASTCVATLYDHVPGLQAPYPILSLPVLLGLTGGLS